MCLEIVAASNNNSILSSNLEASPLVKEGSGRLHVEYDPPSASIAYNVGLSKCVGDTVVLVHQDVYLPSGWERWLKETIKELENRDQKWGVLGIFGVDIQGKYCGRVWSSGLNRELNYPVDYPHPVVSVDELLIVLNRKSGIMFDSDLPSFHLYGTDIVLTALLKGYGAFVFHGPVIHNSKPVRYLDASYRLAYNYMAKKWSSQLPLKNCILPVTKYGYPLYLSRLKSLRNLLLGKKTRGPCRKNPAKIAKNLKYEK